MKKTVLSLIIILSCLTAKAQPDSIPNSSFEAWWFWGGWDPTPAYWITNNSQLLASNIVMDTMAHSGNLAMMMINSGNFRPFASTSFPLSHHPLTLTGYIINNLFIVDTAIIQIRVYSNNTLVDSGYQIVRGVPVQLGYTQFMVPVTQQVLTADSCEIILEGGNQYLSSITFDDLSLTFSTGLEEPDAGILSLFPNPCAEYLVLQVKQNDRIGTVTILDIAGRKISEIPAAPVMSKEVLVPTASLAKGTYLVTAVVNEKYVTIPFLKN